MVTKDRIDASELPKVVELGENVYVKVVGISTDVHASFTSFLN